MATTSIIKQVVIKDKDALKRFVDINNNENPLKLNDVKIGQYEQGKELLKRFSSRNSYQFESGNE